MGAVGRLSGRFPAAGRQHRGDPSVGMGMRSTRQTAAVTGFGQFTDLVANASGWAYLILLLFAYLDALIPIVPSEASVITAGVVAASGDLSLPVVIAIAAL